ncbi:OB-fold nucleic acid binding domain containing protein [Tritrichomonas foetus]|uniref:OB-fold nucleic acid binding domain containing protein n=1 Tax=Tritrichomonas foetus TaxID=1144522 RepID=A0A1J4KDN0_9EUKA|nr:OB-fold nucleic acid binding domain containing protein [Tritrichomonas foetus]|eukprot:OHT07820.1 OB-fold nucleic acid binding domain containing protein [Tritrichomonas foetus]
MSTTNAYIKISIRDVFNCEVSDDGETFFCTLFSENRSRPTIFKNVRLSGMVTQKNECSFAIDDGTGVIVIIVPDESNIEIPKISDYVEVFGELKGKLERSITALCCCLRNEPMEEIRHLLEQAAIHRDYLQYRKLSQQVTFLSSEASIPNQNDNYTKKIVALLESADPDTGVSFEEIKRECDNDEYAARNVIESMANNSYLYESNNFYFPL